MFFKSKRELNNKIVEDLIARNKELTDKIIALTEKFMEKQSQNVNSMLASMFNMSQQSQVERQELYSRIQGMGAGQATPSRQEPTKYFDDEDEYNEWAKSKGIDTSKDSISSDVVGLGR